MGALVGRCFQQRECSHIISIHHSIDAKIEKLCWSVAVLGDVPVLLNLN